VNKMNQATFIHDTHQVLLESDRPGDWALPRVGHGHYDEKSSKK
jgi:hypothetical protein